MRSIIVQGLAFGDESKGATVEKLCRELPVDLIVRFCGGCQTAHHVVLEDGRSHCFSQFGSGMLVNNKIRTHLSRFMLVEPFSMMREADALSKLTDNVWERTTVDRDCVIVTPIHRAVNRSRELRRGINAHGSCGRGIGVAREMQLKHGTDVVLTAKDLDYLDRNVIIDKLEFFLDEVREEIETRYSYSDLRKIAADYIKWPPELISGLEPAETMVFEGAQGVMLDEKHGTAPHNTWTNTTFENADTLLDEIGCKERMRIGCLRTYYTRHGAGPFPTENPNLDLPELHNSDDCFPGKFRVGHFDFPLAKHALRIVGGVDYLAISHLDYLPRLGCHSEEAFLSTTQHNLGTPIGMLGRGPTAAQRTISLEVPV